MLNIDVTNKIQSNNEIQQIFKVLYKNFEKNNNSYFHLNNNDSTNSIKRIKIAKDYFYKSWGNFNQQKRKLFKFLNCDNNIYFPIINERKIIESFFIDYRFIINEIIACKAKNIKVNHSYKMIIDKLIQLIVLKSYKLKSDEQVIITEVDIIKNSLLILINKNGKQIEKKYKLFKFIKKYQRLFPKYYSNCKVNLIISKNWKDVFYQSTFKDWRSCLNLINCNFIDKDISNSPLNNVRSGNLISYLVLDFGDKTIDEIMDDVSFEGLCYQRTIWRCSIKRCDNENIPIYYSENITYGNIMNLPITYEYKLLQKINTWLYNINKLNFNKVNWRKFYI